MIEPSSSTHDLVERVAAAVGRREGAEPAGPARGHHARLRARRTGTGAGRRGHDSDRRAAALAALDRDRARRSAPPRAWRGVPVAVMAGRSHRYEGYTLDRSTFGVRVLLALGARTLIFTNAAGGVGPNLRPGDLMLATDHLNFVGKRGLFTRDELIPRRAGRRVSTAHDPTLVPSCSTPRGERMYASFPGSLIAMHGPSYETAAEIRWAQRLGAGAVCMSTVHEVTVAAELGARAASLSTITNPATGLTERPLAHDEVTTAARGERSTDRAARSFPGSLARQALIDAQRLGSAAQGVRGRRVLRMEGAARGDRRSPRPPRRRDGAASGRSASTGPAARRCDGAPPGIPPVRVAGLPRRAREPEPLVGPGRVGVDRERGFRAARAPRRACPS